MRRTASAIALAVTLPLAACSDDEPEAPPSGRVVTSLNDSGWRFLREDFEAEEPVAVSFDDSDWLAVSLPHDFNGGSDGVHDDVFEGPEMYLGAAWYRTELTLDPAQRGKRLSLRFEAVAHKADVWLNGSYLGQHRGGYTAFDFDVTDVANFDGENTLVVRASNENDAEIAPWMAQPFGVFPNASDYAPYGGMYRDVWLVAHSPVFIDTHFHDTPDVSVDTATAQLRTMVANQLESSVDAQLVSEIVDPDGNVVQSVSESSSIAAGQSFEFRGAATVDAPRLWSPESPSLYTVRSRVVVAGVTVDERESPLGFRWFTLENAAPFQLNGENSFLKGVNRHQDMQGLGYALSNEQHVRDVELIRELGFNFIRHAHYPADEAFVRACDEQGIMLWLEIPVSTTVSPEPGFADNAKQQLREMIEQSYNHPSVILWGLGNESDRIGAANLEARMDYTTNFIGELNTLAKQFDTTRPTTGCNYVNPDNQAIVDIYSPQEWSGWYEGTYDQYQPTDLIGEYGASIHLPEHQEGFISSGSVRQWPQEYATEYHEYKASMGRSLSDQFPGHLVWVAFDFASPRLDRSTNPVAFMNQKGLFLHDHETRKDVAYFYESFNTEVADNPMVYIVSETWLDRITEPGTLTLWAYSNAETVELWNGTADDPMAVSLGTTTRSAGPRGDTRFQWDDAQITGPVLTARARVGDEVVATHSLTFEGSW